MALQEFIDWSIEYFYVYLILIVLYIYFKYKNKETVSNFSLKEMFIIVEIGFYIIIIYLCQKYLFYEHNWFLVSLPILIFFNAVFINYVLNKDNVYLLETAIINDRFYNPIEKEEVKSLTTRLRLLIMDREYYNSKQHIGEIYNPIQQLSQNIKFCDFYLDDKGLIFHSEFPELHNINFFTRIALWLKLKKILPQVMMENISHTWLNTIQTAHQLQTLESHSKAQILSVRELTDKQPFTLIKTMDDYIKEAEKLKKFENEKSEIETGDKENDN